ncbi:ABC transporter permease [uncultured Rikenella sp.]|uniref:ABC transporter permease n=1 Tax=uncultured Rikenella sp. TaxID=368003 RepID=UPI0025EC8AE7|nr:ABC transporter permease [uncultured Rikenella sp.]
MFLKSFFNFLNRNKLYTTVNFFGLSLSLAFVLLLGLYIRRETSIDRQHANCDRIYRLQSSENITLPARLVSDLAGRYPEIEATTRMRQFSRWVQRTPETGANEEILAVDPDFFRMFSFPMVEGHADEVMRTPKEIVLTRGFATALFGTRPALGEHVTINGDNSYTVCGVVSDFENSHLRTPSILVPFEKTGPLMESYGTWGTSIYLMSHAGADLAGKIDDINAFAEHDLNFNPLKESDDEHLELVPLTELYFSPDATEYTRTNNPKFILILGVTALLVLIFAAINNINLSTAQTGSRAKEFAMRRLLGGTRRAMFAGCIAETILFCFASLSVGLLIASLFEPYFADMMGTSRDLIAEGMTWSNGLWIIGLVILLGVICGVVPAGMIAAVRPIEIVRGTFRRKTKMVYSNLFIGLQLCITIVLLCGTITVARQVRYMKSSDLGFDKEYIVACDFGNTFSLSDKEPLRTELAAIPGVESVSFCTGYPTVYGNNQMFDDREGVTHDFNRYQVDTAFMKMLGLRILHRTGVTDADAVWLNETAWRRLGLTDDATEYRGCDWWPFKIAGKVQDFHALDFSEPIGETMIEPLTDEQMPYYVLIKVSPADPFATLERIRTAYNKLAWGDVFDGRFLDDRVADMYTRQTQLSRMMGTLSGVALVISALGLLAVATYYTRQRVQEAAVRKVFGATSGEVLALLLGRFLKLVGVSFVIAVPVGWYFMREWLAEFAYRIPLSWTIFALAGGIVLLMAGGTVLWLSIRTAETHPAVVLKQS